MVTASITIYTIVYLSRLGTTVPTPAPAPTNLPDFLQPLPPSPEYEPLPHSPEYEPLHPDLLQLEPIAPATLVIGINSPEPIVLVLEPHPVMEDSEMDL